MTSHNVIVDKWNEEDSINDSSFKYQNYVHTDLQSEIKYLNATHGKIETLCDPFRLFGSVLYSSRSGDSDAMGRLGR